MMDKSVRIAILENVVEAQMLDSVLTEQEIPHIIQSFHDAAYDGIFQAQQGWGCVIGPSSFQKKIIFVLSDLRKNACRPPKEEEAGE
jgi:hypothetical protein